MSPVLFADWNDADTINALLGVGGLGGIIAALWYGLTRYSRQRASNTVSIKKVELEVAVHEDKVDGDRLSKWQTETRKLMQQQDARIAVLDARLEKKDQEIKTLREEKDKDYKAIASRVELCEKERAVLAEQNKWMRKTLIAKGLLSDHDDHDYHDYPRTKSDQIDTGETP